MTKRAFNIAAAFSGLFVAGALVIVQPVALSAQTGPDYKIPWCNTYVLGVDPEVSGWFYDLPEYTKGINVSGKKVVEIPDTDISAYKVKYGPAQPLKEIGYVEAIKYYIDAATVRKSSRNLKVMHFYPISELNKETINSLIASMDETSGQTIPFFATAMGQDAINAIQNMDLNTGKYSRSDFATTPLWSNKNSKKVFSSIADKFESDPVEARKQLAKFVVHATKFGMAYNPVDTVCDPSILTQDYWHGNGEKIKDAKSFSSIYIGSSVSIEAASHKALFNSEKWPNFD